VVRSFWRCEAGQAVCFDLPQALACLAGAFACAAGRVARLEGWSLNWSPCLSWRWGRAFCDAGCMT